MSYLNNHSFFDPPPGHPDYDPATGKRRAGGGAPVLLLLAFAPLVLAGSYFLVPVFPIAGTLAVIAGLTAEAIFNAGNGFGAGGPMRLIVMVIATMVGLIFASPLESAAEVRIPRYRQIRHWIRVFGLAFMINDAGIGLFHLFFGDPRLFYGWGLLEGVTIVKLLRFAILATSIHIVFRLLATRGEGLSLRQRLAAP